MDSSGQEPSESAEPPSPGAATQILAAAAAGDVRESGRLLELLYGELHGVAKGYMGQQGAEHTLQPTALVHEAWMKLFGTDREAYRDRNHFLATAARAMRQVLVDHARSRRRAKRGGDAKRVELAIDPAVDPPVEWAGSVDLEQLDRALKSLEEEFPRQARIVELRYFGDLSAEDTAEVLGVSRRTVTREWRFARAWLTRALEEPER